MQEQKQGNFMDFKTIMAIVLVGVFWIGWQSHLQEKYPENYKKNKVVKENKKEVKNVSEQKNEKKIEAAINHQPAVDVKEKITKNKNLPEELVSFSDPVWNLTFSSKGMSLKSIELNNYSDRDNKKINLSKKSVETKNANKIFPFQTNLVGRNQPVDFKISKISDFEYIGKAIINGMEIKKHISIDSQNYSLKVEMFINGVNDQFSGLTTYLVQELVEMESSFLQPSLNQQEVFVSHIQGSQTDREYLIPDNPYTGLFESVDFYSLGSQYFATAIIDKSNVLPELKVSVDTSSNQAISSLTHSLLNKSDELKISFIGYAGPKDLNVLKRIDERLTEIVDYGWFSWLAIILFNIMEWFYGVFGNYGVAIILLTLLVRMIVLPFNMMSYKSMKTMQVIQPQIKALREKYKDDQQSLNREMMILMKENKANPMGGCLPMLLQFPVFIALYRVFGQSIELYKAPFALWITDLSLKDPYYVLPVLMGGAFYFQTKLTPSTMDPTQQKIMMFMPVMFAFFMASLPSALTLYMVVSTLFGILQQTYFMKNKTVAMTTSSAKA